MNQEARNIGPTSYIQNEETWLDTFSKLAPYDKFLLVVESSNLKDHPYVKIPSETSMDILLSLSVFGEINYLNEYEYKLKTENSINLNKRALRVLRDYLDIANSRNPDFGIITVDPEFKAIIKDRLYSMLRFMKRPDTFIHRRRRTVQSSLPPSPVKQILRSPTKRENSEAYNDDVYITSTKKIRYEVEKFENNTLTPSPQKNFDSIYQNNKKIQDENFEHLKNDNEKIFKKFPLLKDKLKNYSWKLFEWGFSCGSSKDNIKNNSWKTYKPTINLILDIMIMNFEPYLESDSKNALYQQLLKETLIYEMLTQLGDLNSWFEDSMNRIFMVEGQFRMEPIYPNDLKIIKKFHLADMDDEVEYLGVDTISSRIKMIELVYLLTTNGKFRQLNIDTFFLKLSEKLLIIPFGEFKMFFNLNNYFSWDKISFLLKLAECSINDLSLTIDLELSDDFILAEAKVAINLLKDGNLVPYHETTSSIEEFHQNFQKINFLIIFLINLNFNENGFNVGERNIESLRIAAKRSDLERQKYFEDVLKLHCSNNDYKFNVSKHDIPEIINTYKLLKFEDFINVVFNLSS